MSSFGAPAAFHQAGCGHCGSGLLKNKETGLGRFAIPNNSTEWAIVDDEDFRRDGITFILKKMEKGTPEGQYTYVLWNEIPVIVGGEIDANEAWQNYLDMVKELKREKLGTKWTNALDTFHHLQTDLGMMDDTTRIALGRKYENNIKGSHSGIESETLRFFEETTFKNFELFLENKPGMHDDAELVTLGIKEVRDLMSSS